MRLLASLGGGAAIVAVISSAAFAEGAAFRLRGIVPVICSVGAIQQTATSAEIRLDFIENCNTDFAVRVSLSDPSLPNGLIAAYRSQTFSFLAGEAVSAPQPPAQRPGHVRIFDSTGAALPQNLAVSISILTL